MLKVRLKVVWLDCEVAEYANSLNWISKSKSG